MASAQQLIGLVKSHAEGDADRFFDLAMQLSASEEQKGHTRLADVRRQGFWHQELRKLRESLAHLVGFIMRRAVCDASVALRVSFV